MSQLKVFVLGVGDAFSLLYQPTSMVVAYDGFCLAIDCPDMYRSILAARAKNSGETWPSFEQIDHYLITHVHGDHMNGLEAAAYYKYFTAGKKAQLLTSPEVRSVIWEQRLKASMGVLWDGENYLQKEFVDFFDYRALSWSQETVLGPLKIRAYKTKHHVPTSALLIEAGGRRLGYSCDTAFDPDLLQFLGAADLIIHETNRGVAHTPYEKLAELPSDLRAKMRLVHYPDDFDQASSAIPVLHQGDVLVI